MSEKSTLKDAGAGFHTTLTREIRPIRNWHEWLARWQEAETMEEMLGLLHVGFNASLERGAIWEKTYDKIDRLTFYFTIADGWADSYLLKISEDENKEYQVGYDQDGHVIRESLRKLRHQVARKAFDILCSTNFFRTELLDSENCRGYESRIKWEEMITSERLFPVIQNFFRAERGLFGDRIEIRNLSRWDDKRSHNEQQAVNFLLNLAKFVWEWREYEIPSWYTSEQKDEMKMRNVEMRSRLDSAKPWMVEVLAQLGRLDVLRKWILKLDEVCLTKLKEIALRNKLETYRQYSVIKDRPVATLDEACYVGSKAAWFLKEHETTKSKGCTCGV